MIDLNQQIAELKNKVQKAFVLLKQFEKKFENLKSENRSEIQAKEKELEELRKSLDDCQQEKSKLEKDIKEKITELKSSQLSETDKTNQINQLTTEYQQELTQIDQLLTTEKEQHQQIRNKLIEKLSDFCQQQAKIIEQKEKQTSNLFKTIWLMLILFASFHYWLFQFAIPKYIRKRIKESKIEVKIHTKEQ